MGFELDYDITYVLTTLKSRAQASTGTIKQNHGVYYKITVPAAVNAMVLSLANSIGSPKVYINETVRPGWGSTDHSHVSSSFPDTVDANPGDNEYFLISDSTGNSSGDLAVYFNCASDLPLPMPGGSDGFVVSHGSSTKYSIYVPPEASNLHITTSTNGADTKMKVCKPSSAPPYCETTTAVPHVFDSSSPNPGCWTIELSYVAGSGNWVGSLSAAMTDPAGTAGDATVTEGSGTMSAELQVGY